MSTRITALLSVLVLVACSDTPATPLSTCTSDCDCPSDAVCTMLAEHRECRPGPNSCTGGIDLGAPDSFTPDMGTPRVLSFDPHNLGSWVHGKPFPERNAGTGDSCRLDTDEGTSSCGPAHFEVFTQPGAPEPADTLGVFFFRSFTVSEDARVGVNGSRPAVLVVAEEVIIDGRVTVGAGGWIAPDRRDGASAGTGPGAGGYHQWSFGGSGSGGSYCSSGGLGVRAAESTRGARYGTPTLEPLVGGSSGGTNGSIVSSDGGDGGGAVQIVAGTSIVIGPAGSLRADGGWGGGLSEGSGGGSGGAVLLEAPAVTVGGYLSTSGGNGGTVPGRGAYSTREAEDGGEELGLSSDYGGGGGGFGWLRINTADGDAEIRIDAVVSPDPTHACMRTGTLLPPTEGGEPTPTCEAATLPDGACGSCMATGCCPELLDCEADELCATCRAAAAPGPACSGHEPLVALDACVADRCPTACP